MVSFTDAKLHRDYLYCKALSLHQADGDVAVDAGSLVELTHLRIEQQFEGSVTLSDTVGEVVSVFDGSGRHEPDEEPLSRIIEQINERFGTNFDPADRLFFDAVADKLVRPDIQQQAAANSPENFALVLAKEFEGGVIDQMAPAEDVTIKYLDNPDLQTLVLQAYAPLIQGKAKIAHQEHCPIAELLGRTSNRRTGVQGDAAHPRRRRREVCPAGDGGAEDDRRPSSTHETAARC